jgi:ribosomal protein L19
MKLLGNTNIIKNKKKLFNLFHSGKIILTQYLLLKNDEVKITNFIGICLSLKKKSNTILLKNTIKKDEIKLLLYGHSPLIVKIKVLKKYKKKYRLKKIYYK